MGTGVYQCFCKEKTGSEEEADLCFDYRIDQQIDLEIGLVVSFSIIAINIVLKAVNIILIRFIGYYTES
jgi:hypothetical protein